MTAFDEKQLGKKRTGVVKWFDVPRGWGFATCDDGQGDVFIHYKRCRCSAMALTAGVAITFYRVDGPKGVIADGVRLRYKEDQGSVVVPDSNAETPRGRALGRE
jgi:CspA family cold shock protein